MSMSMPRLIPLLSVFVLCTSAFAQELKLPSLSPVATITQEFSTSKIEIVYSRPSMRGRAVFGELVPLGSVWRTGANAATKVTFGEDVQIGGKTVKAGTYSLYTVPGTNEFEVVINTNTGSWNSNGFSKNDDVVRFMVPTKRNDQKVETFTIQFANITYSTCTIDLLWENTIVSIPVMANNQDRLVKSIEKAINNPAIPYQQAATYLYESNQQLDKALDYATKALERNPSAYWISILRARIALRLGNSAVAREAANKTMELAKGTGAEGEYTRAAQDVLNALK